MFYGRGAGEFPTASAVMGDVIDVMRDIRYNCTGRISCTCYRDTPVKPFAEAENQFVLRMKVENRPGVLASIAGVLGAHIKSGTEDYHRRGGRTGDRDRCGERDGLRECIGGLKRA